MKRWTMAVALGLAAGAAGAQTFPAKPITVHVPFPPGGPTDVIARTLATAMEKELKSSVVVENSSGAGGTVGSAKVARMAPDGYNLLLNNVSMSVTPTLYRKLPYTPDDFAPIGVVATVPMVLMTKPTHQSRNLGEFVAWMKSSGEKANMAHAGLGTAAHLCGLLLQQAVQTKVTTVAYRGAAPAMTDMIGNVFDFMCEQVSSSAPFVTSGKVRGLAVTTREPIAALPGVPTTASGGLAGLDIAIWHGLWAPRGTPAAAVNRLSASLEVALKDPELVRRFGEMTAELPRAGEARPEALRQLVTSEVARWAPIIRNAAEYAD